MVDNNEMTKLLKKIDSIQLIPNDELDKMDFYELSYYMQALNIIDSLADEVGEE